MKITKDVKITASTIWRIERRKSDETSYWMYQYIHIMDKSFKCSLAYIDYRKNYEFMVFDDYWETYCIENIETFDNETLKNYMQDFVFWYFSKIN